MSPDGPIAMYLPELTAGGAQRVTVDLVNGLADRGHDIELLLSYPGGQLRSEVAPNVRLVDFDTPVVPGVGIAASIPQLIRYLRRRRPRILFSAMTYANVVAALGGRLSLSGTPIALIEHTTVGMERGGKRDLTNTLAKWTYGLADRVVAVSAGVADSVRRQTRVATEDVVVLYNPVPVDAIQTRTTAPLDDPWLVDDSLDVVLWVGRFAVEKDLPTLVQAFKSVHDENLDTRLILAGTGPEREAVAGLVDSLELSDVVAFPGYVDPAPYMARASVFVLSSRYEGLPTVLVEALACGCPVVSTDCPSGPREILRDGADGRLVDVGDHEALAAAILSTLDTAVDTQRLRDRAAEFSSDRALVAYEALVDELTRLK